MKQVARRSKDGRVRVVEAPLPEVRHGFVLVANRCSLISAGTERNKLELDARGLVRKARARPDLVRKVVDRARTEGVRPAVAAARERLEALTPIGYSSAGIVLRVGDGVTGLAPGDRVACAGGGYANHAEVVSVPMNLVATLPENVSFESGAYGTLGAIALHGVRRTEGAVGERIGVIGLGLVGQLALRILVAAGCEAYGIDPDPEAVRLASIAGAHAFARDEAQLEQSMLAATDRIGLDAVLICAASRSADPVELATMLVRDRGRIVIVGDVPVRADRALMYEKELELRLSRSYGPGRYDRDYEERGRDLPPGYVRWTEQRNLQAFLDLVASGRIEPATLTTHRFPVEHAEDAYSVLTNGDVSARPFGVLLEYAYDPSISAARRRPHTTLRGTRIGLIGAGNFARGTLLPALQAAGAELAAVASSSGLSAADVAARFGFEHTAASAEEIVGDESIAAVVIATRHSTHASLAAAALRAGKSVFVEKPLALTEDELHEIEAALARGGTLMVGFNRRFAPLTQRLRAELAAVDAPVLLARVNAGSLPEDHWLHDPEEGGGRLLGEGCHFVDLLSELAGGRPVAVQAFGIPSAERPLEATDGFGATIRFAGGAVGTLAYTGGGDARLPKERIEAFGGGIAGVLDDFRRLELYRSGRREIVKSRQDKGHRAQIIHFVNAVAGRTQAPDVDSYLASTRATIALAESLRSGSVMQLP